MKTRLLRVAALGAVAMFEFTVPVGARMPLPHKHERYDETIYGVEGVVTFTVEGKTVDIAPGEFCFVPRVFFECASG